MAGYTVIFVFVLIAVAAVALAAYFITYYLLSKVPTGQEKPPVPESIEAPAGAEETMGASREEAKPETEISRKGGTVWWIPALPSVYLMILIVWLILMTSFMLTLFTFLAKKTFPVVVEISAVIFNLLAALGLGLGQSLILLLILTFLGYVLALTALAYLLLLAISFITRAYGPFAPVATNLIVAVMLSILMMAITLIAKSCETVNVWE